jgi:glycerophosphoryl diester phosphodiesterase
MLSLLLAAIMAQAGDASLNVYFQAHRGGLLEAPENTLAAYKRAWGIRGAVPEVDVTVTSDEEMVCIHDDTPERTTNAPEQFANKPIQKTPLKELRKLDAGRKFDPKYAGEKIPLLKEVFAEMKGREERQAYLDLKNVPLDALMALIDEYRLQKQVIFVHGDPAMCEKLQALYPGARTMTWLSGSPKKIQKEFDKFAAKDFKGVSQLQCHLESLSKAPEIQYSLNDAFLREAVAKTRAAGVELQLRPFDFDEKSLRHLTDLGVRWFVADAPARFSECLYGK